MQRRKFPFHPKDSGGRPHNPQELSANIPTPLKTRLSRIFRLRFAPHQVASLLAARRGPRELRLRFGGDGVLARCPGGFGALGAQLHAAGSFR